MVKVCGDNYWSEWSVMIIINEQAFGLFDVGVSISCQPNSSWDDDKWLIWQTNLYPTFIHFGWL